MNYPIEILLEQKTLLETELVFTEGKELTEIKQRYAEVNEALNTLNLDFVRFNAVEVCDSCEQEKGTIAICEDCLTAMIKASSQT